MDDREKILKTLDELEVLKNKYIPKSPKYVEIHSCITMLIEKIILWTVPKL